MHFVTHESHQNYNCNEQNIVLSQSLYRLYKINININSSKKYQIHDVVIMINNDCNACQN